MESELLSWQSVLFRFFIVFVLILINGFFVTAEFALVGTRPTALRQKARQGNRLARVAERLIHHLDEAVAATQLGITISSLLVGWIGEGAFAGVFLALFNFLPTPWVGVAAHSAAVACAFALITFMHVVFGELIPKSIAIRYPTESAIIVSDPMRISMLVFKPFVWLLNGAGNFMLRLIGLQPAKGHTMVHSVEELQLMIEASHKEGALDGMEKDLLQKVFKFGDLVARQVMVPRTEVTSIQADATLDDVINVSSKIGHTRFPVYEKDIDNIVGILHMKDIVLFRQSEEPFDLRKIMKEAHFIPEAMPIVQILSFFKQKHTQMVVVVDEFGGTSGLVTLEDVIEEIIGDFYDEHHPAVRTIIPLKDNEVLLAARVRLDEINERFKLNLQSEEADTVAGFVLEELGAIPRVGDTVRAPGALLQVVEMANWRIKTLRLKLQPVEE